MKKKTAFFRGANGLRRMLCPVLAGIMLAGNVMASEFSASFQNAKVEEFVNTVSANLNKTIIMDPSVQGNITVRSYETLNEEQYYQFFLSVLEVHGFAVVEQPNGVLKVVRDKDAKTSAIPVMDSKTGKMGDEMISWVMPVKNVPVRELSPILRQLNDNSGNIVHYDPSNILLMTGRAANIERLVNIVKRIDAAGGKTTEIISLKHGSATEMQRILSALNTESGKGKVSGYPVIVADEVGNRLVVSGETSQVLRVKHLVSRLDAEQETTGNTRVFYLKYSVAEDLKEVLQGVGQTVIAEKSGSQNTTAASANFSINVHGQTNALVVTAQPDIMGVMESVVKQLDIRRAQILVEAIIVEVADADGINLSMQLGSETGGLMQFSNGQTVPIGQIMYGMKEAQGKEGSLIRIEDDGTEVYSEDEDGDWSVLAQALSGVSGAAFTAQIGDWTALLQAVTSTSESNVLSTPSLLTLDNEEASFIVGDEVPTLTGATSSANNDNPFQTIERREVGIKLSIKPQVNEGDAVRLDIEQEVSNINGTTPVDITFATRQVKTSVMVGSGETVVIGGLIDENVQESESKVPLLGDIPYIGALFRSTSNTTSKRNLMVFIRPTIIRDDRALTEISGRKYGFMRARQLERAEKGVDLMPNARIPVLSEDMSPQDILKDARRRMDEEDAIRQMRRLEEARELIEQAETEKLEKGEDDDAESNS